MNFDGNELLVFEVAALKEADPYGKTHGLHQQKVAAPKKKASKKKEAKE